MPSAGKEMNFWDLCVACARAIGRGCQAMWRICRRMIRLTYRYWWIVIPVIILGVAAAMYYTRKDNITYRMNAVALLNGPSIQQFEQAYAPLRSGKMLPPESELEGFIKKQKAYAFTTYRVIDCMHDGVADYIDFKHKSSPTDTLKVQMADRLCLQFRIKSRNLDLVPEVEKQVLEFLNSNVAMQQAYATYIPNLRAEAVFNHTQWHKLDSLTSHYYFRGHLGKDSFGQMREGTVVMSDWGGDWRVRLFLEDIYKQQRYTERIDQRLQLATAPVVLENHFAADSKPVNGRRKMLVLFFLLGWIGGCVLAEAVDRRKAIVEWLKKN